MNRPRPVASPLLLAHEVAQLAALMPGADNAERQALQAIHQAIVLWRLGQATEEAVSIKAAALASGAFMRGIDLSRSECWMLGLVSSLLGTCSTVDLHSSGSETSRIAASELAQFVAKLARGGGGGGGGDGRGEIGRASCRERVCLAV